MCLYNNYNSLHLSGLFKVEWEGDGCVALNSKTYYCFQEQGKDKFSAKGVNRSNTINKDMFLDVLNTKAAKTFTNRGFIMKGGTMHSYEMTKNGLSYFYGKRKVAADGVSTTPLDI